MMFQFTPLREGRHGTLNGGEQDAGFNSRPCVRGDSNSAQISKYNHHFIIAIFTNHYRIAAQKAEKICCQLKL